jgi:hypothetical protein
MRVRDVAVLVFGKTRRWEVKLVAARIIIIAAVTAGLYMLLNSGFKRYAYPLGWLLVAVVVASIGYQFVRRWREFKANRDRSNRE